MNDTGSGWTIQVICPSLPSQSMISQWLLQAGDVGQNMDVDVDIVKEM